MKEMNEMHDIDGKLRDDIELGETFWDEPNGQRWIKYRNGWLLEYYKDPNNSGRGIHRKSELITAVFIPD